jgi:hypothetical protein
VVWFWLFNIKDRLTGIGGRIEIHSDPGHWTVVTPVAPLILGQEIPREAG